MDRPRLKDARIRAGIPPVAALWVTAAGYARSSPENRAESATQDVARLALWKEDWLRGQEREPVWQHFEGVTHVRSILPTVAQPPD